MGKDYSGAIIPLNEIKGLLLDLMTNLDAFCRENGLRYALAYGSLLGAVRHKGFIPWDDDIDILMPRPDYLKLLKAYHHPFYEIKSQETNAQFPLQFAKLCDTRTLSIDKNGNQSPIAVDIFILDGLGTSSDEAKAMVKKVKKLQRIWSNQLFTGRLAFNKDYGLLKNIYILTAKTLSVFLPLETLVKRILAYKQSRDIDKSTFCASLTGAFTIYETAKMLDYTDATFEDRLFRILKDFDYELRINFGNYMQLPPEDQRVETHEATAYWI